MTDLIVAAKCYAAAFGKLAMSTFLTRRFSAF